MALYFVVRPYICPISALYFHQASPIFTPIFRGVLTDRPAVGYCYICVYICVNFNTFGGGGG